jgi:hypothetical protein
LFSFYVIKWHIISTLLSNVSQDFFSKNLVKDLWYNRYFFESHFPVIVDKYWYIPHYEVVCNHPYWNIVSSKMINFLIANRNKKNFFYRLIEYKMACGRVLNSFVEYILSFANSSKQKHIIEYWKKLLVKLGIIQRDF